MQCHGVQQQILALAVILRSWITAVNAAFFGRNAASLQRDGAPSSVPSHPLTEGLRVIWKWSKGIRDNER